ncbi:hypothetical protein VSP9026_01668 [Vibrio spartinae]|uniref:Uncharacterized protein n=1 Tax=Vibrio spartinae TaxID=1918945 RepID=A0A1N6M3N6_9VIBR|nr:hypothetical protein VSP9026_01668 [Vibrio spartinae]
MLLAQFTKLIADLESLTDSQSRYIEKYDVCIAESFLHGLSPLFFT